MAKKLPTERELEENKKTNRTAWVMIIVSLLFIGGCAACAVITDEEGKDEGEKVGEDVVESTETEEEAVEEKEITPKPIKLSGSSKQATKKFTLEEGLSIFEVKHSGSANFIVELLDNNGDTVELVANEIGSFNGSNAVGIQVKGKHLLNVEADGSWSITIKQPRPTSAKATSKFSGSSKKATGFFELGSGLKIFEMKHSGSANFIVELLDIDGNTVELLANEIGNFSGSQAVSVSEGVYLLDVDADGSWSISMK